MRFNKSLTPAQIRRTARVLARRGHAEADWLRTRRGRADLAIFHDLSDLAVEFRARAKDLKHRSSGSVLSQQGPR